MGRRRYFDALASACAAATVPLYIFLPQGMWDAARDAETTRRAWLERVAGDDGHWAVDGAWAGPTRRGA